MQERVFHLSYGLETQGLGIIQAVSLYGAVGIARCKGMNGMYPLQSGQADKPLV